MSEEQLNSESDSDKAPSGEKQEKTQQQSRTGNTKGIAYVAAYGAIGRTLDKIIEASTPPRVTQDFITTKLGVKGGPGKAVLPFLKRTGFLHEDGSPTDIYNRFRNASERGQAAYEALKIGYPALYEVNEYAHDLGDQQLKGLVVQVTGCSPTASTVKSIIGSFKALKHFASFDSTNEKETVSSVIDSTPVQPSEERKSAAIHGIQLGYTINLNLPATSEIGVYDAIFKSLKEHILDL